MDWIFQISEWARTTLGQVGTSPVTLPFAFILGLASAVASTSRALPVLGAVAGYAGMKENIDKRSNLLAAFLLHDRHYSIHPHFGERCWSDRLGRPKRPWRLLEDLCGSHRHYRWPWCHESPSLQYSWEKGHTSANWKTWAS